MGQHSNLLENKCAQNSKTNPNKYGRETKGNKLVPNFKWSLPAVTITITYLWVKVIYYRIEHYNADDIVEHSLSIDD
jgi:hypothetical protein